MEFTTKWYKMKKVSDEKAEIDIYDEISYWGVTAKHFIKHLKEIGSVSEIILNINSPGGNVFDGVAIYNRLLRHPAHITVNIDGLAASIASVVALSGDVINMADNALFMIHNPSSFVIGEAKDMLKMAKNLEKIKSSLFSSYTRKTGKTEEEISDLMDDETWFTAQEAKDEGFIDEITENIEAVASFDLSGMSYKNPPESYMMQPTGNTTAIQKRMLQTDRIHIVNNNPAKEKTEEYSMTDLTLDTLNKERPDLVEAIKKQTFQNGVDSGVTQERERVKTIVALYMDYKVHEIDDVLKTGISEGLSPDQTDLKIKNTILAKMQAEAPESPGPSNAYDHGDPNVRPATFNSVEDEAKYNWENDGRIRDEFELLEKYTSYLKSTKQ